MRRSRGPDAEAAGAWPVTASMTAYRRLGDRQGFDFLIFFTTALNLFSKWRLYGLRIINRNHPPELFFILPDRQLRIAASLAKNFPNLICKYVVTR